MYVKLYKLNILMKIMFQCRKATSNRTVRVSAEANNEVEVESLKGRKASGINRK